MSKPDGKLHRRGGLTLHRKAGEGFKIDENTSVEVLKCSESGVYLSIKAPGRNVLRTEIVKNQPRQKKDQSQESPSPSEPQDAQQ